MVFCVLACCFIISFQNRWLERRDSIGEAIKLGQFIAENISNDDIFTMYDSGVVSYFSGRRIIPANGLAGDYELAALAKKKDSFGAIIGKFDVDWVILIISYEHVEKIRDIASYISKTVHYGDIRESMKEFAIFPAECYNSRLPGYYYDFTDSQQSLFSQ